jgi:hypothetical protein
MTFFDELEDLLKGPFDSIPLANAAVYSLGFSIFGVPAWKCVIVGVIAFAPLNCTTAGAYFPASAWGSKWPRVIGCQPAGELGRKP